MISLISDDLTAFPDICRLCFEQEEHLTNIFGDCNNNIAAKIMTCVSIEVLCNNRGPQKICNKCLDIIDKWLKLKKLCEYTNSFLKTHLSRLESTELSIEMNITQQSPEHNSLLDSDTISCPPSNMSSALNDYIAKKEKKINRMKDMCDIEGASCTESNMSSIFNFCFNEKNDSNLKVRESPMSSREVNDTNMNENGSKQPVINEKPGFHSNDFTGKLDPKFNDHNYPIIQNDDKIPTNVPKISETSNSIEMKDVTNNSKKFKRVKRVKRGKQLLELKTKEKKNYTCEICNIDFTKFTKLLNHDLTTHKSLPANIVCPVCGKLFLLQSRLDIHILKHGEKTFECNLCEKKFLTEKSLTAHRNFHTEKYRCQICGYCTISNTILLEHQQRHNKQKSFTCFVCDKDFSSSFSLSRHKKTHYELSDSFKCNICNKVYPTYINLKYHMTTIHESSTLMCEKCGINYKTRKGLLEHLKKHNADPENECSICLKTFYTKYELFLHNKSHTHCKEFYCEICKRKFSYKHTLRRHIFSHTILPSWLM